MYVIINDVAITNNVETLVYVIVQLQLIVQKCYLSLQKKNCVNYDEFNVAIT